MREWLNAQAAGGFVEYDPASGRYTLPPEQTVALTDSESPAYLPGFFQIALGSILDSPRITDAAQSGAGDRLARAPRSRLRGLRALLPPRLQREPGGRMAAGARRRGREARARREGGRPRLRPRLVDDPDGAGVPELDLHRLRLPRRLDRDGACASPRGRRLRPRALRGPRRRRPPGHRLRPRDDVRLPPRHGRSGRRGPPGRRAARPGWDVDDRRAQRRRSHGGQLQPGRPGVLRVLDAALHARVALAGGRASRSAHRPARPASATSSRRAASAASAAPPRRPSTSSSRRASEVGDAPRRLRRGARLVRLRRLPRLAAAASASRSRAS